MTTTFLIPNPTMEIFLLVVIVVAAIPAAIIYFVPKITEPPKSTKQNPTVTQKSQADVKKYKNMANALAGLALISMAVPFVLLAMGIVTPPLPSIAGIPAAIFMLTAAGFYLKSKHLSLLWLVIVLLTLSLIGQI